jgi:hypothetical protein
MIGIAVQHAVSQLGQLVVQIRGFGFEHPGVLGGSCGKGVGEPRQPSTSGACRRRGEVGTGSSASE